METLRLFGADEGGPARRLPVETGGASDPNYTVRQAWEEFIRRPHREKGKAESTLRDQRTHLDRWDFWAENHRTASPMVHEIRFRDLEEWQRWLRQELSGVTLASERPTAEEQDKLEAVGRNVNKHLKTVQQVLSTCAGRQLINGYPKIRQLPCRRAAKKISLRRDEVGAIYQACEIVDWPRKDWRAVLEWRTAIVIWTIYGLRTQELFAWELDQRPLKWSNVLFDSECPENDGRDTWTHGWLSYVPKKQDEIKPLPVVVPLERQARRHLEAMLAAQLAADDKSDLCWHWPRAHKYFYAQWDAIIAEASRRLDRPRMADVDVNHLRKTAQTWHEDHGGKELADVITGHAPRGLTAVHYDVPYGRLVTHFGGDPATGRKPFESCEVFEAELPKARSQQLRLF